MEDHGPMWFCLACNHWMDSTFSDSVQAHKQKEQKESEKAQHWPIDMGRCGCPGVIEKLTDWLVFVRVVGSTVTDHF